MKERPLLFSAPMVRAVLDGSKTQTRRIMKTQPHEDWSPAGYGELHAFDQSGELNPDRPIGWGAFNEDGDQGHCCQYGQPGDRLYVRETWRTTGDGGRADYLAPRDIQPHPVWYDADGAAPADQCAGKTRVSIHMPRWASRILLEIVSVRVERLNDISEADAWAEGVERTAQPDTGIEIFKLYDQTTFGASSARRSFKSLWESINGTGSWADNPWVWVIEFKRVTP